MRHVGVKAVKSSPAIPRSTCATTSSPPPRATGTRTCWRSPRPIRRPARCWPRRARRSPRRSGRSCSRPGVQQGRRAAAAGRSESPLIKNTLAKDPTHSEAEALEQIYALLRPGDAPNLETARQQLQKLFFNPKRYDLGRVGRYKINQRLRLKTDPNHTVLTEEDFIAIIRYLIDLHDGRGFTDDIDHLGNRRIRSVGELIANQFSVGLSRMARLVKERMSINSDPEKISLDDLVNARTVSAVIQAFFGSLAALAVHGPDQPAGRADQQAPAVGARAGRPDARARGLRSPRRALLAVRPDVPDRDAGRPEHRPDHQPLDLRPDQRPRLHRDAVPGRQGRPGHRRDPLALGQRRRGLRGGPGQRGARRRRQVRRPAGALPEGRRLSRSCRRTGSTSWTWRRSSSSRSRRR